jgi:hypothetical protein
MSVTYVSYVVIPAAFSARESGEGIERRLYERHWVRFRGDDDSLLSWP